MAISQDRSSVAYQSVRSGAINATPDAVWPWLVQMGYDRGGWYAIDQLEKLFGVGRFATGGSAKKIEPELQQLAVGDRIPLSQNRWLNVTVLDRPKQLLLTLPSSRRLAWTWQFALTPLHNGQATRLTITTDLRIPAKGIGFKALSVLVLAGFHLGQGMMERVQLRTLAARVPAAS
jgi:hypothetical protein